MVLRFGAEQEVAGAGRLRGGRKNGQRVLVIGDDEQAAVDFTQSARGGDEGAFTRARRGDVEEPPGVNLDQLMFPQET